MQWPTRLSRIKKRAVGVTCRSVHLLHDQLRSSAERKFDVVVIGGGHAGCEAASASARCGAKTILITHKLNSIGLMACNPRFGGLGKGHLMRELDAMDGVSPRNADQSAITFQALNRAHGPAVLGLRAQIDRNRYPQLLQDELVNRTPNLYVLEAAVEDLVLEHGVHKKKPRIRGCVLADGTVINSTSVVITTGTFLRAEIFCGVNVTPAGRRGEDASYGLSKTFQMLGLELGRFRTGTSPRLNAKTIDFTRFKLMPPDVVPDPFSFLTKSIWLPFEKQLPTYAGYTNPKIVNVVKENLDRNRYFIARDATGPRYCPSLESKVMRFPDINQRHDGLETDVIYLQGAGMTFEPDVQLKIVRIIDGLENVEIIQPGYGVLYDYVNPKQLTADLSVKCTSGLYLAGQINGTTGYEEAAVQGLVAGTNAARLANESAGSFVPSRPFMLDRSQAYTGVLIDDLTSLGTSEPYRMFTSRAEFRLHLRPDNADIRLTTLANEYGLVSAERWAQFDVIKRKFESAKEVLETVKMPCSHWKKHYPQISDRGKVKSALQLMHSYGVTLSQLYSSMPDRFNELKDVVEDADIEKRLLIEGMYEQRHQELQQQMSAFREELQAKLPEDLDYNSINAINLESRAKLDYYRPANLAAASRVEGITPDTLIHLMRFVVKEKAIEYLRTIRSIPPMDNVNLNDDRSDEESVVDENEINANDLMELIQEEEQVVFDAPIPPGLQDRWNLLARFTPFIATTALGSLLHPSAFTAEARRLGYEPYACVVRPKYLFFGPPAYFTVTTFTYVYRYGRQHGIASLFCGYEAAMLCRLVSGVTNQLCQLHMDRHYPDQLGGEMKYTGNAFTKLLKIGNEEGIDGLMAGLVPSIMYTCVTLWSNTFCHIVIARVMQYFRVRASVGLATGIHTCLSRCIMLFSYPLRVYSSVLAVANSGLAIASPPILPKFNDWTDVRTYFQHHDSHRGFGLLGRPSYTRQVGIDPRFYIAKN
ncbi:Protein MTO1-like protein, mitochondrial [Aphelenchoides besseyi]|nr:Protein MTO1-like protein, mitochondrial [Aphelenchoides besseyi]